MAAFSHSRTRQTSRTLGSSDNNNEYEVTVTASKTGYSSGSVDVTVRVTNVNEPPVGSTIGNRTLAPNVASREIVLSSYFSDPERDDITYIAKSSSQSVVRTSVSESVLTLTRGSAGSAIITVTAADRPVGDADRQTATERFTVTVQEDSTPPPVPSGLEVTGNWDRTLEFTWNVSPGATSYHGLLTPGRDVDATVSCSPTAPTTSCTFNNLTNGTIYSFRVKAVKAVAGSDNLESTYADPPKTATPSEPVATFARLDGSAWGGSVSVGESEPFSVDIRGLSPTRSYQFRLGRENPNGTFGFVDGCTDELTNSATLTSVERINKTFTYYGCSPTPLVGCRRNFRREGRGHPRGQRQRQGVAP